MAHHQRNHAAKLEVLSSAAAHHSSTKSTTASDDEVATEPDEPPDRRMDFPKRTKSDVYAYNHDDLQKASLEPQCGKQSLLTQALLSSPDLNPMSDNEAPVLTSDGGMTSPTRTTTPSPPLPAARPMDVGLPISDKPPISLIQRSREYSQTVQINNSNLGSSQESKVEEGLGRKRCISFACGRQPNQHKVETFKELPKPSLSTPKENEVPKKRPCILRFACPTKPSCDNVMETPSSQIPRVELQVSTKESTAPRAIDTNKSQLQRDSVQMGGDSSMATRVDDHAHPFNRVDPQKSEATRFNEFAGNWAEDEWINEQTAYRQKLTVDDTLRKENAIRQLAREAEEEGLDEDEEDNFDDDSSEEDREEVDEALDDGNESDNEEGFADSDDESEANSEYHFWTPGLTTAATSTEHLDHIRPITRVEASDSSFDSLNRALKKGWTRRSKVTTNAKKRNRVHRTPNLPDSTEFIVGTLDEDRPLEEAYKSCLEERRRSKQPIIPQDIDPSFPTSEPEADDDEEDEEYEETTHFEDDEQWVTGRPDTSEDESSQPHSEKSSMRSAPRSPKRIQSPPPKRRTNCRSPPPTRRLFGQSTHRLRSPPPLHGKLTSPPSSRRPSLDGSLSARPQDINVPRLAQRPNLTHITSLPRTPNPFWDRLQTAQKNEAESPSTGTSPATIKPAHIESYARGPIDIVQGLETKRQRRKDKYWRQHCRDASKLNKHRCQPGKGAERMKELGEMMSERCRGYGQVQRAGLVLSL